MEDLGLQYIIQNQALYNSNDTNDDFFNSKYLTIKFYNLAF